MTACWCEIVNGERHLANGCPKHDPKEASSAATVRLRYKLVIEYDARPADYEGTEGNPEKMAALDLESVRAGHLSPYDLGDPVTETVQVLA